MHAKIELPMEGLELVPDLRLGPAADLLPDPTLAVGGEA